MRCVPSSASRWPLNPKFADYDAGECSRSRLKMSAGHTPCRQVQTRRSRCAGHRCPGCSTPALQCLWQAQGSAQRGGAAPDNPWLEEVRPLRSCPYHLQRLFMDNCKCRAGFAGTASMGGSAAPCTAHFIQVMASQRYSHPYQALTGHQ